MKNLHKFLSGIKLVFRPFVKLDSFIRKFNYCPELMSLFFAIVNYVMIEMQFSGDLLKYKFKYTFLNILIIYLIFMILNVIIKHTRIAFIIGNILMLIYTVSQYYIIYFRGVPWQFSDLNFATMEGGAEVAGGYSFIISRDIVEIVIVSLVLCVISFRLKYRKLNIKLRLIEFAVITSVTICVFPRLDNMLDEVTTNREVDFYSRNQPYKKLGHVLMFCMDAVSGSVEKPDGYSISKAQDIVDDYTAKEVGNIGTGENANVISQVDSDSPNIIAIMNESFSDLKHLSDDFTTNEDYMPYIHNLRNNTIKGYVTVSAYGGYSCNSEYEFLTGNTLGFLPVGSTTFTQFLNREQPSLVSQLKSYGYTTIGFSGCKSNIWGLENAYDMLQFDKSIFYQDLEEQKKVSLSRGYVSDKCLYENIEEMFNNKKKGDKYFVWNTTMQNHGGYSGKNSGSIKLTNTDVSKDTADELSEYLSSIKWSDTSFKSLLSYFSSYDEKVIIVMFGDHYPHLPDFYKYIFDKDISSLSIEDFEKLHQTPFIIWANYDIKEEEIDKISLNYLSTLLMETAGLKKSGYQTYLSEQYKTLPIISAFGYEDNNGNIYSHNTDDTYDKIINKYKILQYNNIFDKRVNDFFD